jgi:hypothetical protein
VVAFGRAPEFDEQSREYPIRTLLGVERAPQTSIWDCYTILDQGTEGACVGFSWAHELAAEPEPATDVDYDLAMALYHRAQFLDQWPETPPEEGSSVLAGAKATMETGGLVEYRWSFNLADLLETVSYFGPVVLGINWYTGMLEPAGGGSISVSGSIAGGHAILCRGVDTYLESVLLHNSWGREWGNNGTAWLSWNDLDRLLHEDGESCVPVVRAHVGEPIPPEPEPEPIVDEQKGCFSLDSIKGLFKRWTNH